VAEVDDLTLADPERLAGWLDTAGVAPGEALSVEALAGGASNAMFLVQRGGRTYVLRRPAKVAVARADEDRTRWGRGPLTLNLYLRVRVGGLT
jgi:aminoglycoside phosphotransferase (APT) family kinase protein